MHALANLVLGSISQAFLIVSLCYMIPFLDFMAILIQSLITLRQGMSKGLIVILVSAIVGVTAKVLVAWQFFDVSLGLIGESVLWALTLSLPLWLFSGLLRKTVSLTLTLQAMTIAFIVLFLFLYYVDINIMPLALKNTIKDSVNNLITMLVTVREQPQPAFLNSPDNIEILTKSLVNLFEVVSLYLLNLSILLLARMWQSRLFMPNEFIKEFTNLRSGTFISAVFVLLWMLVLITSSDNLYYYLIIGILFGLWFVITGISFSHWIIKTYQFSLGFTIFFYVLLFIPVLSGFILLLLFILGLVDGFVDLRSFSMRLRKTS